MAVTMKDLGIDKLSVDERVLLAHEIWKSVDVESESAELTPELMAELDQRIADYEANPTDLIDWEEIKRDNRRRYG